MTAARVFSLRPVEAADADFLFEMFVASRERELGPIAPEMRDALAQMQYRAHRNGLATEFPDAEELIVLGSSQAPEETADRIGTIILARRPDELRVVDIALRPDHRNRGLGTALLTSLMDECRRQSRIIKISVAPYNPARRLYARLGLRELNSSKGLISLEWRPD